MRIVSLLPSATEIVYALGLEEQLVGVTFECDEPARARTDKRVVVGGHPGRSSGVTSWADLRAARPEVVFVAPCGFGLAGAAEQAKTVQREVPGAEVWALDGDAVVVRPGPRVVDGVEAMADVLHGVGRTTLAQRVPPLGAGHRVTA